MAQYTAQEDLINLCSGYGTKLQTLSWKRGQFGKRRCSSSCGSIIATSWLFTGGTAGYGTGETIRAKLGLSSIAIKTLRYIQVQLFRQIYISNHLNPNLSGDKMMGELSKNLVQNTGRSLGIILSLSHILGMQLLKEN